MARSRESFLPPGGSSFVFALLASGCAALYFSSNRNESPLIIDHVIEGTFNSGNGHIVMYAAGLQTSCIEQDGKPAVVHVSGVMSLTTAGNPRESGIARRFALPDVVAGDARCADAVHNTYTEIRAVSQVPGLVLGVAIDAASSHTQPGLAAQYNAAISYAITNGALVIHT